MTIGVFLRNYKTYQNINYIPLSSGESFCGLVGVNGVGKSSVLEALDTFFNGRVWNGNIAAKKQGQKAKPYIVPIFLIKKSLIKLNGTLAENISKIIWDIEEKDLNAGNRIHYDNFRKQRELIKRNYSNKDYYLIPIGRDMDNQLSFSIFNTYKIAIALELTIEENMAIKQEDLNAHKGAMDLLEEITKLYNYLYLPKDIDPKTFVKLETHEIQVLMGETLSQVIDKNLPDTTVRQLNEGLQGFLDNLSHELEGYAFRKSADRQMGMRKNTFNTLIIQHFFETRQLHKQAGDHWIDIKDLSSGEKQKAIIDLAFNLLSKHNANSENLILAIDEPENSLHISSCFEQFLQLFTISSHCHQLLFSTHWYGFFPTIDNGFVAVINRVDLAHIIDMVSLSNYREEIKQQKQNSQGKLPFDIRLKSVNDFSQSIIASVINSEPFNWLICEGSSEKVYFEAYLKDLTDSKKLRIIPVGGASEIKRIYSYLSTAYEDFKTEIKGRIFLISDTDTNLVNYETHSYDKLLCKRIVNDAKDRQTKLVSISKTPYTPETEIEDCLNGRAFHETLLRFKPQYPELLFVPDSLRDDCELNSYFYLDLKPSEASSLKSFFDKDNNKWKFSKVYIEILNGPDNNPEIIDFLYSKQSVPEWINEIRLFFEQLDNQPVKKATAKTLPNQTFNPAEKGSNK